MFPPRPLDVLRRRPDSQNPLELERWVERLDALGIRHGGIVDASYGSGLSFRDPDGIALEFFAPPS
jgi:catechol-2,3-dioxygenase